MSRGITSHAFTPQGDNRHSVQVPLPLLPFLPFLSSLRRPAPPRPTSSRHRRRRAQNRVWSDGLYKIEGAEPAVDLWLKILLTGHDVEPP
eukprot:SAG31_NODE_3698_length_3976_cov_13.909466_2_plen_90_part_00